MFQKVVLVASAFVCLASADTKEAPHPPAKAPHPRPHHQPAYGPPAQVPYGPPQPYKPVYKPVYKPAPYKEAELPPQPFQYQYGVQDDYSGVNFQKEEVQDEYGNRQGIFVTHLPDGRIQTWKYTSNGDEGFISDVSYEGEAQYPPEPKDGYGKPASYGPPHPKYPVRQ